MKQRRRIYYTDTQKALMWERWQKGESLQHIAQLFDRNHSSVQPILAETGGIRPPQRHRSRLALTLAEREEIRVTPGSPPPLPGMLWVAISANYFVLPAILESDFASLAMTAHGPIPAGRECRRSTRKRLSEFPVAAIQIDHLSLRRTLQSPLAG